MSSKGYTNPETDEALNQALEQVKEQREAEKPAGVTASPVDLADDRNAIAGESQPGIDLPEPEQNTAEWRGTELPFDELGDSITRFAELNQEGDEAALAHYAYELFGEKCRVEEADEAYWRQFDFIRDDDTDDLLTLFERLTGGEDLPDDAAEAAEEFRDERGGA